MMDQDERLEAIIHRVRAEETLQKTAIPQELAQPKSFLKILRANHYNWESGRFRKIFGMRFSVKIPPIEQLNTIFYPRLDYSNPIFIFFCMLTKRKLIAHLNVNCPFNDSLYLEQWVEPLAEIRDGFDSFETKDRYPDWMKKYRNRCTIFGLFPIGRLSDINDCCFAYLEHYMQQVRHSYPESDAARLDTIRSFHEQWVQDIRTQDKAQGMMAKMIGAKTAQRIFYEVTT
jgi:hypothetical protein